MKLAPTFSTLVGLALLFGMPAIAADKSSWGQGADDAAFQAMLKSGFRAKGIATLARLDQDLTQAFCSDPERANSKEAIAEKTKVEAENAAAIKWPADGKWLGDWKEGEKIAQSGRGFTWTDNPGLPVGGNCYNCHQISPKESSFGTIGPSLFQYGKLRGNTPDIQKYTYSKIWNAKGFNVCSEMPRFGHVGALNEQQVKHLVALLLDPESPVNK